MLSLIFSNVFLLNSQENNIVLGTLRQNTVKLKLQVGVAIYLIKTTAFYKEDWPLRSASCFGEPLPPNFNQTLNPDVTAEFARFL